MRNKIRSTEVFVKKASDGFYEIKENSNTIGNYNAIRGLVPTIFQTSIDDTEFQIGAILIEYPSSTKLIVLSHFEYFGFVSKEIKTRTEEWEWYEGTNTWTPVFGDNREFTKDGILYSKTIYVSKTTGLPVAVTHDENGQLLDTVMSNYDFYFPTLKAALIDPQLAWINSIIQ
jgi:hypothetical protein